MNLEWIVLALLVGILIGLAGYLVWTRRHALGAGWKVSRNALFEKMSDGVIVLDAQNRIADINSAALGMLGARSAQWIGQSAAPLEQALPAALLQSRAPAQNDVQVHNARGEARILNVRVAPLDEGKPHGGRLMILQDITERKHNEQALERMNRQLQVQLAEIQALQVSLQEQATRDPLTGLYNRRFLLEMLSKELKQSARTQRPVSVVMMDIDRFKSFNDMYGHAAGDVMLTTLSDWLRTRTRRGDLVCRYGGDEFLVVLSGMPQDVCLRRAQEWCETFRELRFWHEDTLLHTTLSLGVSTAPTHGATPEELIHSADMGMYAAKEAGRDCVRAPEDADMRLESSGMLQPVA